MSLSMNALKNMRRTWEKLRLNLKDQVARVANGRSHQLLQTDQQIKMLAYCVRSISECVSITDMEDRILFVNEAFLKTYGYSNDELLGKNIKIVRSPNSKQFGLEILQQTKEGGWQGELMNRRKNGEDFLIQLATSVIRDDQEKAIALVGVAKDITESKKSTELVEMLKRSIDLHYDGVYWMDSDNRFVYVNETGCKALGYTRDELMKKTLQEINPRATSEALKRVWEKLRSEKYYTSESVHRRKDGSEFPVEIVSTYVQFGGKEYNCGFARDITARRAADKALRGSEERYRTLAETAEDMIFIIGRDDRIQYVNNSAAKGFGVEPKDIIGKRRTDLFPAQVAERQQRSLKAVFETGESRYEETLTPTPSGNIWLGTRLAPVKDERGKISAVLGISRDITNRIRVEEQLRASEERYRVLTESSLTGVYLIQDGVFQYVNPVVASIFGYSVEELVGKTGPLDLTVEEDHAMVMEHIRRRVEGEISEVRYTFGGKRKDGTRIDVEVHGGGTTYKGRPAIVGTLIEISERRRAEEALKRSEEKFHELFDGAPVGYHELDAKGYVTNVNRTELEMLGYTREEMVGQPVWHFVSNGGRSQQRVEAKLSGTIPCDTNAERAYLRKDGSSIPVLVDERLIVDEKGNISGIRTVIQDITARKRTEESLHKLLHAVQQTDEVIFITDLDGSITFVNAAFENLYGYMKDEVLGKNPRVIKSGIHTEQQYRNFWNTISSGNSFKGELINKTKTGRLVTIEASVNPLLSADGKLVGFIGVQKDITERKKAQEEHKKLEGQLIQAQKLDSIGTLAGGIAHDFNNILGIILAYATMLARFKDDESKALESIGVINKAVQRGASLVKQILTFARKTDVKLEPVRVNDVISELSSMLSETFPKTVERVLVLEKSLPVILTDHTQLHQALLNLCVNARDAMRGQGKLTIETKLVSGGSLESKWPQAAGNYYICVSVSDTGSGMDEETKRKIFEPFFTTKEKGKGTGLGLAVVYGIMQAHHGYIDVESVIGEGSTFSLYLPVPQETMTTVKQEEVATGELPGGSETILIVEDEDPLRAVLKNFLESQGYRVISAANGEDGLAEFYAKRLLVDLIITDIGLPKISGDQLLQTVHAIDREVPVIITSGFVDPELKSQLFKAGAKDFIQKPYSRSEVLKKVRDILDLPKVSLSPTLIQGG